MWLGVFASGSDSENSRDGYFKVLRPPNSETAERQFKVPRAPKSKTTEVAAFKNA